MTTFSAMKIYSASPDPVAAIRGPTSKERGKEERGGGEEERGEEGEVSADRTTFQKPTTALMVTE